MKQQSSERARMRRLRAKYRKRTVIVAIIFLIIGIVLGIVGDRMLFKRGDVSEPRVVEVMVTPTPAPEDDGDMDLGSFDDEADYGGDDSFDEGNFIEDAEPSLEGGGDDADFGEEFGEEPGVDEPAAVESAADIAETAADAAETAETAETAADEGDAGDYTIAMQVPESTPEPTPVPTPAPTPVPATVVVPYGDSYEFTTQIKQDGTARIAASSDPFETVSFTMSMQEYLLPSDFASKWGNVYKLQGTEAGAGFEMTLNNYVGNATIIPQNIVKIAFVSESGNTENLGYQLMDAEIAGNLDVELQTNVPKTLWKRYTYSNTGEPLKYLAVTTYNNGVSQEIRFELESDVAPTPDPLEQYSTLTRGDKKDAVIDLQKRLIDLGFLSGTADGNYGAKTQDAVRAAQKEFGMEETGTATPEFQLRLFTDAAGESAPAEAAPAEDAPAEDAGSEAETAATEG